MLYVQPEPSSASSSTSSTRVCGDTMAAAATLKTCNGREMNTQEQTSSNRAWKRKRWSRDARAAVWHGISQLACFVHLTNAVGDSGHCACPLPCMHHPPKGHTVASTPSDRRNRTKKAHQAIRNKHTKQPGKKNTYSGSPCRSSGNAAVVVAVAAAVVVAVVVVAVAVAAAAMRQS